MFRILPLRYPPAHMLLQPSHPQYSPALLQLNPNIPETHFNLGALYNKMGNTEKGVKLIDKAYEIVADSTRTGISFIHNSDIDFEKMINKFVENIEINPDDITIYMILGEIYDKRGFTNKALEYYRKYLQLGGNDITIKNRINEINKKK